jgi:hypothetical protein
MHAMSEFERWVGELVTHRYGTAGRLAFLIGISESAFSRGVKTGTLGVESLLRLALETGEPVGDVLRRAGKAAVAALLDDLCGESAARLTGREQRLLALFRGCQKPGQDLMLQAGRAFQAASTAGSSVEPDPA